MFPIESSQPQAAAAFLDAGESLSDAPSRELQAALRAAWGGVQAHLSSPGEPTRSHRKKSGSSGSDSESASSDSSEAPERPSPYWDEQVSDAELWIAAGAAPEGADDKTIYRIYERYVSALKDLSWRIDPALKDIAVTAYEAVSELRDIFRRNTLGRADARVGLGRDILRSVREDGRILIPSNADDHAMLMQIEVLKEGGYLIRLYNSGYGLRANHQKSPVSPKFATHVEYQVSDLSAEQLDDLMRMSHPPEGQDGGSVEDVYGWLKDLPGAQKIRIPRGQVTWQTQQKTGDCVLEVLNAFLRDSVARAVRTNPALSHLGNVFSKALYREMKASYLRQVVADYTDQNNIDGDAYRAIEAIKARADRAEISARFVGKALPLSGVQDVREFKDYMRLYNQVLALEESGETKGSIWFNDRRMSIKFMPDLSRGNTVVFQDFQGSGQLFSYDRDSRVLKLSYPMIKDEVIELRPDFDPEDWLQSMDVVKARGDDQESRKTYSRLDAESLKHSPDLLQYLSPDELESLSKVQGEAYLIVDHQDDGRGVVRGYIYDYAKSSATKFEKAASGGPLQIFPSVKSSQSMISSAENSVGVEASNTAVSGSRPSGDGGLALVVNTADRIQQARAHLEELRALATDVGDGAETGTTESQNPDGTLSTTQTRITAAGEFQQSVWSTSPDGRWLNYQRSAMVADGTMVWEQVRVSLDETNAQDVARQLLSSPIGKGGITLRAAEWQSTEVLPMDDAGQQRVIERRGQAGRTLASTATDVRRVSGEVGVTELRDRLKRDFPSTGDELPPFLLDEAGAPVDVAEVLKEQIGPDGQAREFKETRYFQKHPDGSTKVWVRVSEDVDGQVQWRVQDIGADGGHMTYFERSASDPAWSRGEARVQPDGTLTPLDGGASGAESSDRPADSPRPSDELSSTADSPPRRPRPGAGARGSADEAASVDEDSIGAAPSDSDAMSVDQQAEQAVTRAELAIAAGASNQGADDYSAYQIYRRYAQTMEAMAQEAPPELREQLSASARLLREMSDVLGLNAFDLDGSRPEVPADVMYHLEKYGRILIPAFSSDHAMLAYLEKTDDGYRLRIYNSGDGVEANHAAEPVGPKHSAFAEYRLQDLTEANLAELLSLDGHDPLNPQTEPQDVYDWAQRLPGAQKVDVPVDQQTWQTTQKSGDCTLEVVNAFLRDNLARAVRNDPVLSEQGPLAARKLYLQVKAAYLEQVRADFIDQNGVTADSALLLEALRVRADRARIAASYGSGNGMRAGNEEVRSMKAALHLCTQLQALARSGVLRETFWYSNRQVRVMRDAMASQGDTAVYKELGPGGAVFRVNKNTGEVQVTQGGDPGFQMKLVPKFDEGHHLVSLDYVSATDGRVDERVTYFHEDAARAPQNQELAKYLSPQELAEIAKMEGDFYVRVERSPDSGQFELKGYVHNHDGTAVTSLVKDASGRPMLVQQPIAADAGLWPTEDSRPSAGLNFGEETVPVDSFLGTDGPWNPAHDSALPSTSLKGQIEADIALLNESRGQVPVSSFDEMSLAERASLPDGGAAYRLVREAPDGRLQLIRWTQSPDGATLSYVRLTTDEQGRVTREEGRMALGLDGWDTAMKQLRLAEPGQLASSLGAYDWRVLETQAGSAAGDLEVTQRSAGPDGSVLTQPIKLSESTAVAASEKLQSQLAQEVVLSPEDAAAFAVDAQGSAVAVEELISVQVDAQGQKIQQVQTRYIQKQSDGSTKTLIRIQLGDSPAEWRVQSLSADGKNLTELTRMAGSEARSQRTAVVQADGSLKETLMEVADPESAQAQPDEAVVVTERTTSHDAQGNPVVEENVAVADSVEHATQGRLLSRSSQTRTVFTHETGQDGVMRTRRRSSGQEIRDGVLTATSTELVTARKGLVDVVESSSAEVTTGNNVTVRTQTSAGQTQESVKVGDSFVDVAQAPDTPEVRAALAMQDLAQNTVWADLAAKQGIEVLEPLLGNQALSSDPEERRGQLESQLEARASGSMKRVYTSGALSAGGGAMALYQAVVGSFALRDAIKAGSTYGIALGSTGVAAGAAQIAELGVMGASLMTRSSKALAAMSRIGSVAGRLALGLGVVAMAMSVPGLVDAIKRGDTKAIVSSSVGLGGGVAAMVLGPLIGGVAGMGVGLVLGGLVIGFIELFNKFFNPGTPISGENPLEMLTPQQRMEALGHAQVLFAQWEGSLSKDRLQELAQEGASDEIKAAAKYFVDNEGLIHWIDAANGGGADLEMRDASYDGEISKSDLSRFIGYVAVPPEIYRSLPAPSEDARLWALGILDPQTHQAIVDEFGKDGEGQGSGDGVAALAEYANIASGRFDDRLWGLLKEQHPDETDEQTSQRRDHLKKACAYFAAHPSELRALESFKTSAYEVFRIKPGQRTQDGSQVVWRLEDGSELRVDTNRLKNDLAKGIFDRLLQGESITEEELAYLESDDGSEDLFEGDDWDTWMQFAQHTGRSTMPPKVAIPGRDHGIEEDGRVGTEDIEQMRSAYQARIDELLSKYPDGLPSFNDAAQANQALGQNNPALWRPGRFGEDNPERPQSYYRVVLDAMSRLDSNGNGEIDWREMAEGRERALHDKAYGLYYALDHVMRKGPDVFPGRGEGMDLKLTKADLSLKAGQDRMDLSDVKLVLPISAANRATEAATLSQFIEAHAKEGDRLELDDLSRLCAGYWQDAQGAEIPVPDAVRQAALYWTQNPAELASLTSIERAEGGSHRWIAKAELKAAAQGTQAVAEVLPQNEQPGQKPLQIGVRGITPDQQSEYWLYLDEHFDGIECSENPGQPADGHLSLGDLRVAQRKALESQDWPAYDALGSLLQGFEQHWGEDGLISKDTIKAQAARSVLDLSMDQVDASDGSSDGLYGLAGLAALKAHLEKQGQPREAQYIDWLIRDYQVRIDRLVLSLDVDEGMRADGRPADDLISIQGDVRKQLDSDALSDSDRAALTRFLDNESRIAHYGDNGDLVNAQDVKNLLSANLQWFDGAREVAQKRELQQAQEEATLNSGLGLDL